MQMEAIKSFIISNAKVFRAKYSLGIPCGRQLEKIIPIIEEYERINISLIKKTFKSEKLYGFIGYKYNRFVIVINTNKSLGTQYFTLAHEIYHLLNQREDIKNNALIELDDSNKIDQEELADLFAIELLMPEEDFIERVKKINRPVDYTDVIMLQNYYEVDYKAITKRLLGLNVIDKEKFDSLNKILESQEQLDTLIKQIGGEVSLNLPTKEHGLREDILRIIKKNYDDKKITYEDLVLLFYWMDRSPEDYGYEQYIESSKEVEDIIDDMFK